MPFIPVATAINAAAVPPVDGWTDAGETWTYASADAPAFTFTVAADVTAKYAAGQRIKLTQTTVKYFIITAVSTFSGGNTTITVYGGTDYTLANASITSPYWSMLKAPFGFPLDPAKWTVSYSSTANNTQASPTATTWYNLGSASISIPIGAWLVDYQVAVFLNQSAGATLSGYVTLSTANNSETNPEFTGTCYVGQSAGQVMNTVHRSAPLTLAAKATYYLNTKTGSSSIDNLANRGDLGETVVSAVCAYL